MTSTFGLGEWLLTDDMLSETRPDVFCFATLPNIRLELIELGVKYGVRAIAFEKPMATSLGEAKQIHNLCEKAGVKTIVSHQHKYGKHWRRVREIIENGDIGEIHTIYATAKGWLLQYGTHLVDYMMFLNAGVTVYGSEGYAQVVVGSGWRAAIKSSSGLISGEGEFNVKKDQPPYIRDMADWLDDPGKMHPCNGEVSYHGFQLVMGICLISLERRKVTLPIESDMPIMERLAAHL